MAAVVNGGGVGAQLEVFRPEVPRASPTEPESPSYRQNLLRAARRGPWLSRRDSCQVATRATSGAPCRRHRCLHLLQQSLAPWDRRWHRRRRWVLLRWRLCSPSPSRQQQQHHHHRQKRRRRLRSKQQLRPERRRRHPALTLLLRPPRRPAKPNLPRQLLLLLPPLLPLLLRLHHRRPSRRRTLRPRGPPCRPRRFRSR